jgi:hypothetical protein
MKKEKKMEVKLIEIRDRQTFISAIAIKPASRNEKERYLMARAGYGRDTSEHEIYVLFARLDAQGMPFHYSPARWGDRTMSVTHRWLIDHWEEFESGDVIDVEFILGESKSKKKSKREGS